VTELSPVSSEKRVPGVRIGCEYEYWKNAALSGPGDQHDVLSVISHCGVGHT